MNYSLNYIKRSLRKVYCNVSHHDVYTKNVFHSFNTLQNVFQRYFRYPSKGKLKKKTYFFLLLLSNLFNYKLFYKKLDFIKKYEKKLNEQFLIKFFSSKHFPNFLSNKDNSFDNKV
jgi:hypothetical protein